MYSAGFNFPGCLPEMEPATFYSESNARNFLIDELRSIEEDIYHEQDNADDIDSARRHYNVLVETISACRPPLSVYDGKSGLEFWIDVVPDQDE